MHRHFPYARTAGALALLGALAGCSDPDAIDVGGTGDASGPTEIATLSELGELLFHDTSLSLTRNQSCASCHNPDHAFIDNRDNALGGAVSLGDDGRSFGNRNSPTLLYAALTPNFSQLESGEYFGGQFHDGRARHLRAQVNLDGGPFLNPAEMMMPDRDAVVSRIQENPAYVEAFKTFFGEAIFSNPRSDNFTFTRIGQAIAAFEELPSFMPFDSRYDRYRRGEETLSVQEAAGLSLFEARCSQCHSAEGIHPPQQDTFTNYRYYNIGVPINLALREALDDPSPDPGLLGNPEIDDPLQAGKFKTPTLRNVAVTAPYMHNGVLHSLRAAIKLHLYRGANNDGPHSNNPDTNMAWGQTDYPETVDREVLSTIGALGQADVDALIAFLRTLTDARYEALDNVH